MTADSRPAALRSAEVRRAALRFLREEAGFAQLVTVNRDGFPVARTVGAPVNDDWSVDLVQRRVHRRLGHLRRNPRVELIWVGEPLPGATNDHPAVYDFGLLAPRVVLLRGAAEPMTAEWTLERYRRRTAIQRASGLTKAPERDAENVRAELVGIRIRPVRARVEGFGVGAETFSWSFGEDM